MRNTIRPFSSILLFCLIALLPGCYKQEGELVPDEVAEPGSGDDVEAVKTDVATYEIVHLIVHHELADRYAARFGAAEIELLKTSDSTLTFYVPDIPEGKVSLKFDLATVRFNVIQTPEVDPKQLLSNVTKNFDARVGLLKPTTPEEIAEVNELKQYRQEVVTLFNSLSDEEKRQTALFYEANKELFQSFSGDIFTRLNAPTTFRDQSDCPKTDFKSFYGCTAENLGNAAVGLARVSKEFLQMLAMAGFSIYLAPASLGLSAVGTALALVTAAHLFMVDVRPAWLHFKHSFVQFREANWIFGKALFLAIVEVFKDGIRTGLNLKPTFRSITANDATVSSGARYLISAMASLKVYWDKLAALGGSFPAFRNKEEPTTLLTNEISITNISNPNVKYLGHEGQEVRFQSLSGKEETFSYRIRVAKQGFVEEKTLSGKVVAAEALNYKLEFLDDHIDGVSNKVIMTLSEGDEVTLPNYMQHVVRLTLDGIPVKARYRDINWNYTYVQLGFLPVSARDTTVRDYPVTIRDATNNRDVTIRLHITFSNQAFARIVGKQIRCTYQQQGMNVVTTLITFRYDGTYTKVYADGSNGGDGQYSFFPAITPNYVPCDNYVINKAMAGCIYLPQESSSVTVPNYIYIYADNTVGANSFYGCDGFYVIQ